LSLKNILIPISKQPNPQQVVDTVQALLATLQLTQGRVILLYVGQASDAPRVSLPADSGWAWEQQVSSGDVVDTILQVATDSSCDLVAMATAGRHGFFDALRVSTTEQVLRRLKCPLLAVPA
jgi:nucleotide-binding universal stress UspA family protein